MYQISTDSARNNTFRIKAGRFSVMLYFLLLGLPMRDEHTEYSCAAALAIEVLQGKWRIQILCVMRDGPVRLGQLGRRIPTASKKVLTENLRNLESAGLIVRTDMSRQVRHVEYDLTVSV